MTSSSTTTYDTPNRVYDALVQFVAADSTANGWTPPHYNEGVSLECPICSVRGGNRDARFLGK